MYPINIKALKPGQAFSFTGDPAKGFPCVVLDSKVVDLMVKKAFNGGQGYLWHVYLPSGSISWSNPELGHVFVAEPIA